MDTIQSALADLRGRYPGAVFLNFFDEVPQVARDAYIAPGAVIAGSVLINSRASVWFNAVVRADVNQVNIGEGTNIQDGTVIHVSDNSPTVIGNNVVVGHRAIVHGCCIDNRSLIGMGATILDDATVASGSIIGAGALIASGTSVAANSLYLGIPAKRIRSCTDEESAHISKLADKYQTIALSYARFSQEGLCTS